MQIYLDSLKNVLMHGKVRGDRTGTGTLSVFGGQRTYPLSLDAFPIVTTKYVNFSNIVKELLWFIQGDTNSHTLEAQGCNIWRPWGYSGDDYVAGPAPGDLGPVYGAQWRNWNGKGIDQLTELMENLKKNPTSRRHILTAWNPEVLPIEGEPHNQNIARGKQVLPPCHTMVQFYVEVEDTPKGRIHRLSSKLYQRSLDKPLGEPYNITSYALLTALMAHCLGYELGVFIHTVGDEHIYLNQLDGVNTQITRRPKPLPKLVIDPNVRTLTDFTPEHIHLEGYVHDPVIAYLVAT